MELPLTVDEYLERVHKEHDRLFPTVPLMPGEYTNLHNLSRRSTVLRVLCCIHSFKHILWLACPAGSCYLLF